MQLRRFHGCRHFPVQHGQRDFFFRGAPCGCGQLGAPESRPLADFLPTISIKAKDFAAEMTSVNVQQKDLYGQQEIGKEHVDNNAAVRDMLLQRGIVPEQLPPSEDVKKVERRLKSEEKRLTGKAKKK